MHKFPTFGAKAEWNTRRRKRLLQTEQSGVAGRIEVLETRSLLSAISVQPISPMDSLPPLPNGQVVQMTLHVNGSVYELATSGNLYTLPKGANVWQFENSDITQIAIAPPGSAWAGDVFALTTAHALDVIQPMTGLTIMSWPDIQSFAFGSDGSLDLLNMNGQLQKAPPHSETFQAVDTDVTRFSIAPQGSAWAGDVFSLTTAYNLDVNGMAKWSNIVSFGFGSDGSLYTSNTSGLLQKAAPGSTTFQTVDTSVTLSVIAPQKSAWAGTIFTLNTAQNLDINGSRALTGVQSLTFGPDGALYYLTTSGLLRTAPPESYAIQTIGTGITRFDVARAGSAWFGDLFSLTTSHNLNVNGVPTWSNIQSFGFGTDGSLYLLTTTGLLQQALPESKFLQTLDTGVTQILFAPPGSAWYGDIFSLTANHNLDVDGKLTWSNIQSFAFGPDASLYLLTTSGQLQQALPESKTLTPVDSIVTGFAIARIGSAWFGDVFSLTTDHHLDVNGKASWTNIQSFAFGSDGSLYLLTMGGVLQKAAPGSKTFQTVDTDVTQFAIAPSQSAWAGIVFSLTTAHDLDLNGSRALANAQSFAFGPDGSFYYLTMNGLLRKAPPESFAIQTVDTDVTQFRIAPAASAWGGDVFSLTTARNLDVNGSLGWANVLSFSFGGDGSLFLLTTNGVLQKAPPGSKILQTVDTGVLKFGIGPEVSAWSGEVFSLTTTGNLDVNGMLTWSNIKNFAFASDASLYLLTTGGLLEKAPAGSTTFSPVDTNVKQFILAPPGSAWYGDVFARTSSGDLDVIDNLDTKVLTFANIMSFNFAANGTLYVLRTNGLFQMAPPESKVLQTVDTGVSQFAIAPAGSAWFGGVISLTTAHNLDLNGTLLVPNVEQFDFDNIDGLYFNGALSLTLTNGVMEKAAPESMVFQTVT